MPPGTGDIALTLSQVLPLTGAVVVCTPQDVALLDAVKAIAMFRKVNIPVLGMVENMSGFICPDCGKRYDIFGSGGARAAGRRAGRAVPGRSADQHADPRSTATQGKTAAILDDPQVAPYFSGICYRLVEEPGRHGGPSPPLPALPVLGDEQVRR